MAVNKEDRRQVTIYGCVWSFDSPADEKLNPRQLKHLEWTKDLFVAAAAYGVGVWMGCLAAPTNEMAYTS
jgi:hypothetical protein